VACGLLYVARMRWTLALLAGLVACGPDPAAMPGSFSGDNCTPTDGAITSLVVTNGGAPVAVGQRWIPSSGGQGLQMSGFDLALGGSTVPSCVQVYARAEHAVLEGPKRTITSPGGWIVDVLIGPVDDSYAIDADVAGLSAHVEISGNVVTAVR
jgi:hypothetical protein